MIINEIPKSCVSAMVFKCHKLMDSNPESKETGVVSKQDGLKLSEFIYSMYKMIVSVCDGLNYIYIRHIAYQIVLHE